MHRLTATGYRSYVCFTRISQRTVHGVTRPITYSIGGAVFAAQLHHMNCAPIKRLPIWYRSCVCCTLASHRTVHGVTCPIWHRSCVSWPVSSHWTVHRVTKPMLWYMVYVCCWTVNSVTRPLWYCTKLHIFFITMSCTRSENAYIMAQ